MPTFYYKAIDHAGRAQRPATLMADTARHARQLLRERGLIATQIEDVSQKQQAQRNTRLRLKKTLLNDLTRQFAALLSAGLTIDEVLQILAEQAGQAQESHLLSTLRAQINEGASLSVTLAAFPRVFPAFYRILIAAGEESGKIPTVMQRLADYLEARGELNAKISLAFVYPALVLVVSLLVVIGMLSWVVPQMVQVFASAKQSLPLLTRMLLAVSDFFNTWGIYLLLLAIVGSVLFMRALRIRAFRLRMHLWRLNWPLLGQFDRAANTARFASTLSILVGAGVPLLNALAAVVGVMNSLPMQQALEKIAQQVREGMPLSRALKADGSFPPVLVHLVASGEATGRLDEMLDRAAQEQSKNLSRRIETFTALLGPAVVIVMGVLVLCIVLAILLPVFEMNQLVK